MFLQLTVVKEAPGALGALVWLFYEVDSEVLLQLLETSELAGALGTFVVARASRHMDE